MATSKTEQAFRCNNLPLAVAQSIFNIPFNLGGNQFGLTRSIRKLKERHKNGIIPPFFSFFVSSVVKYEELAPRSVSGSMITECRYLAHRPAGSFCWTAHKKTQRTTKMQRGKKINPRLSRPPKAARWTCDRPSYVPKLAAKKKGKNLEE